MANQGSTTGAILGKYAQARLSQCAFVGNEGKSLNGAGAIDFDHSLVPQVARPPALAISQSLFRNNTSGIEYGTIATSRVSTELSDTRWQSNSNGYGYYAKPATGSYAEGGNTTATQCEFYNQTDGGGMRIRWVVVVLNSVQTCSRFVVSTSATDECE